MSLVSTNHVHIDQNGVFAYSNITDTDIDVSRLTPELGLTAASAVLHAQATVANAGATPSKACVVFTLHDGTGAAVGSATTTSTTIPAGSTVDLKTQMNVTQPELWSSRRPYLYSLSANVTVGSCQSPAVDSVTIKTGFRSLRCAWLPFQLY